MMNEEIKNYLQEQIDAAKECAKTCAHSVLTALRVNLDADALFYSERLLVATSDMRRLAKLLKA